MRHARVRWVVGVESWEVARVGLLGAVARADREVHREEFRRVLRMLDYAEAARVEADSHECGRKRQVARQTVRHLAPLCWFAWARGDFGAGTVRLLAEAVNQLRRESSAEVLDSRAVGWLPGHTPAEVRAWLALQVHRLEPEESAQEARRVEADRRFRVTHRGDGMSEFWALLPTRHAAAIEKNLRRVRAAEPAADPRTRAQWAWDLPAALVRDLAACKGTRQEFSTVERVVTDPIGNVLDVTRLGYEFSRAHKHAMQIRDGPPDPPPDPIRRQIAAVFAGRTQDIDLEPIAIPWSAFGWRRPTPTPD